MSGIAEVLLNLGYSISGSDLADNPTTSRLKSLGISVYKGHEASHVGNSDAVVVSTAVANDNPEVLEAQSRSIPIVPRAMMLAELMRLKQGIAVAGTHGKTTTTSLIASILAEAQMDPTFVIGGKLVAAGANARLGKGEFLVAEADESDASFLHLQPVLAVVTNIDADHMETYGHDFGKLKKAFIDFIEHLPFYGMAVLCGDDPNIRKIKSRITKPILTYGVNEGNDLRAIDIRHDAGKMSFKVIASEKRWKGTLPDSLQITLNLPGHHNVLNSLAAIAVAWEVGASNEAIIKALAEFGGVGRRFQRYGKINLPSGGQFTLIDDYGHHPAEMEATLAAVRGAFPNSRLMLAFQPHRYTRTRDLFEDFVKVLSRVDRLILTEVYSAGEAPIVAADSRALARAIRIVGKIEPIFVEDIFEVPSAILANAEPGDVVVTMGAGSIGYVPGKLID